jgi:hypothetical protein
MYTHSQQISGVKNFKFMQITKEEKRKKYEVCKPDASLDRF